MHTEQSFLHISYILFIQFACKFFYNKSVLNTIKHIHKCTKSPAFMSIQINKCTKQKQKGEERQMKRHIQQSALGKICRIAG